MLGIVNKILAHSNKQYQHIYGHDRNKPDTDKYLGSVFHVISLLPEVTISLMVKWLSSSFFQSLISYTSLTNN